VSPSGVQILSPPPIFPMLPVMSMRRGDRAAEGAALEMPCTGNRTASSNLALSATFLVRTSGILLCGPRGAFAPEGRANVGRGNVGARSSLDLAVLDGELAVPCNPQSASAGLNSLSRAVRVE
jgi:hypothetical protein